ncbi:phage tail protein [Kitasatospora sp. NPDC091276]|uniref:phage tail protein n=1 Tax=Kitasatospora sp. NPDC091276 TaxID=3155300 RepID=UPI003427C18E
MSDQLTFAVWIDGSQVETLQSVSGLAVDKGDIEIQQVSPGTGPVTRPGPVDSGEVTITRGRDKSKAFTDWIKRTSQNPDAARGLNLALLDSASKPVRAFLLVEAWASAAWGADGAIDTVTIACAKVIEE